MALSIYMNNNIQNIFIVQNLRIHFLIPGDPTDVLSRIISEGSTCGRLLLDAMGKEEKTTNMKTVVNA